MISAEKAKRLSEDSAKELLKLPLAVLLDNIESAISCAMAAGEQSTKVDILTMKPCNKAYSTIDLKVLNAATSELKRYGYYSYFAWSELEPYNNSITVQGSGGGVWVGGGYSSVVPAYSSYPKEDAHVVFRIDWANPSKT